MYAVFQSGGKQYRVSEGDEVHLEKLSAQVGDTITFEEVLLTSDGQTVQVGQPYVKGSKVVGQVIRHDKDRKVLVLKYKRRKGYRRKRGHRQHFTRVRIQGIEA